MSDVIAAMATLPVVFRQGEDSAVAIAARGGFAEHRGAITVSEIADFLGKHPTLVDSWWLWSMDKRTDRGWFFSERALRFPWQPRWVVGYFPRTEGRPRRYFRDKTDACATFILREFEHLSQYVRPPNDR